MSGGGGSQDTVTAVRRSKRNNKEVDCGSSMEVIEESDGDEDLEGYSSGTEGPISVVHARRVDPDGNDNLDLDEPQPESASGDEDVDENTGSQSSAARNVDRTLVWKTFFRRTSLISQGRHTVVVRSGQRTRRLA